MLGTIVKLPTLLKQLVVVLKKKARSESLTFFTFFLCFLLSFKKLLVVSNLTFASLKRACQTPT